VSDFLENAFLAWMNVGKYTFGQVPRFVMWLTGRRRRDVASDFVWLSIVAAASHPVTELLFERGMPYWTIFVAAIWCWVCLGRSGILQRVRKASDWIDAPDAGDGIPHYVWMVGVEAAIFQGLAFVTLWAVPADGINYEDFDSAGTVFATLAFWTCLGPGGGKRSAVRRAVEWTKGLASRLKVTAPQPGWSGA
jgi:hypothetical protein